MTLETLVLALDYASVLIFALTGALVASRGQLDPVGFIFFATLTGIGGGTLRDLVLGRDPVFWVERPELILLTTGAALLVFFTPHLLESRYRALLWLDACALAVAVPAGVGVALEAGVSPVVTVVMGVMTGTFGGALAAVVLMGLGCGRGWALILCAVTVFALRGGSMIFGWKLPVYKARPPR